MTEEIEMTESEAEEEETSERVEEGGLSIEEIEAVHEKVKEAERIEARTSTPINRTIQAAEKVLTIPSSIWSFSAGVIIPPLIPLQVATPLVSWAFAVLGFTYAFLGLAMYHGALLAAQGKSSTFVAISSPARIKAWAHWASIILAFVCAQGLAFAWQGGFVTDFRADALPFFVTATGTFFAILYTTAARFIVEQE